MTSGLTSPTIDTRMCFGPLGRHRRRSKVGGSSRLEVEGEEISFSDEEPGFQVVFETGKLSELRADEIVAEICQNIEAMTGQKTQIVKL
jgi:hypothetical protein